MFTTLLIGVGLLVQGRAIPQPGYRADQSDVDLHIVNGVAAQKGEYPWMLSLEVFDPEFRHTCGASLLDSRHALTAAHCLDGRFNTTAFRVTVGCSFKGDAENPDDDCEQIVNVARAVMHEDYNTGPGAYPNDIAMMYLEEEVIENEFVQGATLGSDVTDYTPYHCTSSGWGKLAGIDEGVPAQLQKINISVLTTEECRGEMPVGGNINVQPDVHLCIFDTRENIGDGEHRGICQGDSGGPVQCNVDGVWHMLGAASWVIGGIGGSTCNPAYPGVYADATNYLDWIEDKINDATWKPEV